MLSATHTDTENHSETSLRTKTVFKRQQQKNLDWKQLQNSSRSSSVAPTHLNKYKIGFNHFMGAMPLPGWNK
jgi:hypothetical protein